MPVESPRHIKAHCMPVESSPQLLRRCQQHPESPYRFHPLSCGALHPPCVHPGRAPPMRVVARPATAWRNGEERGIDSKGRAALCPSGSVRRKGWLTYRTCRASVAEDIWGRCSLLQRATWTARHWGAARQKAPLRACACTHVRTYAITQTPRPPPQRHTNRHAPRTSRCMCVCTRAHAHTDAGTQDTAFEAPFEAWGWSPISQSRVLCVAPRGTPDTMSPARGTRRTTDSPAR